MTPPSGSRRLGAVGAFNLGVTVGVLGMGAVLLEWLSGGLAPLDWYGVWWLVPPAVVAQAILLIRAYGASGRDAGFLPTPEHRVSMVARVLSMSCLFGFLVLVCATAVGFVSNLIPWAVPPVFGGRTILGALLLLGIAGLLLAGLRGGRWLAGMAILVVVLALTWQLGPEAAVHDSLWDLSFVVGVAPVFWIVAALAPILNSPRWRNLAVAFVGAVLASTAVIAVLVLGPEGRAPYPIAAWPNGILGVGLVLLLSVAISHCMVAGYHVLAGVARLGLVPPLLVRARDRRRAPVGTLVVFFVSTMVLLVLQDGGGGRGLLILGQLGLGFFGLAGVITATRERSWPMALVALFACAGLHFSFSMIQQHGVPESLPLTGAFALAMLGWKAYSRNLPHLSAAEAERAASEEHGAVPILALHEALEVVPRLRPRVLVATQSGSNEILERAVLRAGEDAAVAVLFVDELPGMFYPPQVSPSARAIATLVDFCGRIENRGVEVIPIWRVAHDPAASIAQAGRVLAVERVLVDVPERAPLSQVLRGQTLGRLRRLLGKVALEIVRPAQSTEEPSPLHRPSQF